MRVYSVNVEALVLIGHSNRSSDTQWPRVFVIRRTKMKPKNTKWIIWIWREVIREDTHHMKQFWIEKSSGPEIASLWHISRWWELQTDCVEEEDITLMQRITEEGEIIQTSDIKLSFVQVFWRGAGGKKAHTCAVESVTCQEIWLSNLILGQSHPI